MKFSQNTLFDMEIASANINGDLETSHYTKRDLEKSQSEDKNILKSTQEKLQEVQFEKVHPTHE